MLSLTNIITAAIFVSGLITSGIIAYYALKGRVDVIEERTRADAKQLTIIADATKERLQTLERQQRRAAHRLYHLLGIIDKK